MNRPVVKCLLLAAMLSLLALVSAQRATGAELLPPIIYSEPGGWYRLNTPALQYLVADAESWEATAKVWEEAYDELSERYKSYVKSVQERLERMEAQMEAEREAARRNSRRWGVGLFGGYGTGGATVGIGIVWRVM